MPAPKKNLFALGNKGGHPPIFKTPEDLEKKLWQYFEDCVTNKETPRVTSLALYLGFSNINSLYDQRTRSEEFSGLINRALLAIMDGYVQNLDSFKPSGSAIFVLTNMDKNFWRKASTTDITSGGEKLTSSIDLKNLSPEQLDALEAIVRNLSDPK